MKRALGLLFLLSLGVRVAAGGDVALIGARIWDGSGRAPIEGRALVVREGRIAGLAPAGKIPTDLERVNLAGKFILPGLISSHVHVGSTRGLSFGPQNYSRRNVLEQLERYARYGVTTVLSLGGDQKASLELRDAQRTPALGHTRLYVAGRVITAATPEEARAQVDEMAQLGVDFIKIRVDDNLGTTSKMPPEVYRAVIARAHAQGLRVAAHVFYLEDALDLLRSGADFLAHSVRDRSVSATLIELLKQRGVCLCPTLTREVSTFIYGHRPEFFDDPFFRRWADPEAVRLLEDPARQQQVRASRAGRLYKKALEQAKANLVALSRAGVRIAFGTDSGPPGRFPGFFEQMELDMMVQAGLTPAQALLSATRDAARCLGLGELGTLEVGHWADLVVLEADPLEEIGNIRRIHSVWIAGNRVFP